MPAARGSQTPWGNQTRVLTPEEAERGGYVMGPSGYYLTPGGDLAPGQVTPGQRDNPQGQTLYDPDKDLNFFLVNGNKVYQSPYDPETGQFRQSLNGPAISDTGGGLVHGHPQWNPQTGKWDVELDWGKIMSWAIAGGLTAGVLSAAMAGGAAAPAAAGGGGAATAGGGGAAGAAAIPTTTIGTASTLPGAVVPSAALGGGTTAGVGGGTTIGALVGPEGGLLPTSAAIPGTAAVPVGGSIASGITSAGVPAGASSLGVTGGAGAIGGTGFGPGAGTQGLSSATLPTSATIPGSAAVPTGVTSGGTLATGGAGSTTAALLKGAGKAGTVSKIADLAQAAGGSLSAKAQADIHNQYLDEINKARAAETNALGQARYIDSVARLATLGLEANSQNLQALAMHDKQLLDRQTLGLEANQQNLAGLNYYDQALLARGNQGLAANAQNIQGEDAYRNQLLGMMTAEERQRAQAYKDVARASLLHQATSSPFNPRPSKGQDPALAATLNNLQAQGASRLESGAQYDTRNLPAPKAYQPYTPTTPAATPYTPYTVTTPPPTPYTPYSVGTLPTPTPYQPYTPTPLTGSSLSGNIGIGADTLSTLLRLYGEWGK
jgi:hypothetical protein